MTKKLMFVVNVDWIFLSHRLPIALAALQEGYEVHLVTGITDRIEELRSYGIIVHPLAIERDSTNLLNEWKTFSQLVAIFKHIRPDLLHLVTIKPVLYGGMAARLSKLPAVVAAVPGLGFVFVARGVRAFFRRSLIIAMYRVAFAMKNLKVIFQNKDDELSIRRISGLDKAKVELIRGSGVDLVQYKVLPLPKGVPVIVMAARLIEDKGVREFVEASRLVRQKGLEARFCLLGTIDPSYPNAMKQSELEAWQREGLVELFGYRTDMAKILAESHIAVLPSYREGLPKFLIEAAACGRVVITTDVPGCRDAIEPGLSGVLVPVRHAQALADAIYELAKDEERSAAMGLAGRRLAEQAFDIQEVVKSHLRIYEGLIKNCTQGEGSD